MAKASAVDRWRKILEKQARSGLTVAEFCRREELSQASFYQWRKKLRAEEPNSGSFIPLAVLGSSTVSVDLPCGAVVRVPAGDERALQQVLSLLMSWEAES